MDALRCLFVDAADEVLIDFFRHERDHRSCCLADLDQSGVQRHVSVDLILLHALCPEALTASSDIPVAHLIDELLQSSCGLGYLVGSKVLIHGADGRVKAAEQPFIHDRKLVIFQCVFCGIKFVDVCVKHEERIGVPERAHKLTLAFDDGLAVEAVRQPRCAVDIEIPADGIGAVGLERFERIHRVAFGLAHLLAVFVLHVAEHDDVLVRSLVEQQGRLRKQGVEPASGLVDSLGDELCRELSLEEVLVLKRIMMLCEGHCAGIEPAVDNLGHPLHLAAALGALDGDLVDIRSVKLDGRRRFVSAHLGKLFSAADRVHVTAGRALPDVERSSPVTVTRDAPVLNIFQPVAEASLTDALGDPVDGVVVADQIVLHRCHLDEPGFSCIVEKRGVTSPAVRIIVLKLRRIKEKAACIEFLQDFGIGADRTVLQLCIGRFRAHSGKRSFLGHKALGVDKAYERHVVFAADTVIVFTESRCDVNDAGTVGHGYIVVTYDEESLALLICHRVTCAGVQRLIFFVFQIFSCVSFQDLVSRSLLCCEFTENRVQKRFRHIVGVSVGGLYLAVGI